MSRVKICGLTRPEDIQAVNRETPDYIGFVFAPGSRRCITPEQAAALRAMLAPAILPVGVFVDAPPAAVAALLNAGTIAMAQLHGREDEDYLTALRALTSAPLIQAFRVRTAEDVRRAANSSADYILLDSGAGSGTCFSWSVLADCPRPYFLAGGLNPDNVGEAVRRFAPFAVDVSSGVESDGHKDPAKIHRFMQAVRPA